MRSLLKNFRSDEAGYVVSAELVMVGTITVTGLIVGLAEVRNAMVNELADVSESIGSLDQSYRYSGFVGCRAITAGSCYVDHHDECGQSDFCHIYRDEDRLARPHRHDDHKHLDQKRHSHHDNDDGHGHHLDGIEEDSHHHQHHHHRQHHHRHLRPEGGHLHDCDPCLESRPRLYDIPRPRDDHHHEKHRSDDSDEPGIEIPSPAQPELPEELPESNEESSV